MSVDAEYLRRLHMRRMHGAGWDVPQMIGGGIWSSFKKGVSSFGRRFQSLANTHLFPAAMNALAAVAPVVANHARVALGAARDNVASAIMSGNLRDAHPLRAAVSTLNPSIFTDLGQAAVHGMRSLPKL